MSARSRPAARMLCAWVGQHAVRFKPTSRAGQPSLEDIKPLGDLALVLLQLTGARHQAAGSELATWALRTAEALWSDAEAWGHGLAWSSLPEVIAEQPVKGVPLLVLAALEEATGRALPFHDALLAAVAPAARRGACASLEFAFLCDLLGLGDCRSAALAVVEARLSEWDPARPPGSSWLYALTHELFYATRMGRRPTGWSVQEGSLAAERLGHLALSRLALRDFDLAAELFSGLAWVDPAARFRFASVSAALEEVAHAEGSVPPYPRLYRPSLGAFENRYHPSIVTLGALAEASLSPLPGVSPAPEATPL